MTKIRVLFGILTAVLVLALLVSVRSRRKPRAFAGVVKDPTGAVVSHAQVCNSAVTAGKKETETDSSGYYRFANLPPDTYTLSSRLRFLDCQARRSGHRSWPPSSVDFKLDVGSSSTVVEVNAAAPIIDTTTNTTLTNITEDVCRMSARRSFQSVIQFRRPLATSLCGQQPLQRRHRHWRHFSRNGSNEIASASWSLAAPIRELLFGGRPGDADLAWFFAQQRPV